MIKIENLCFSYTGAAPFILDHLNLDIKNGEYISVLGENGSGKSTLMKLILGFLRPTKGGILNHSRRTGYVPQRRDASDAVFPITVFEMLNSYRRLLKIRDKGVIDGLLEQVRMEAFRNVLMGTLSGGQSQKLIMARALMGDPDLLILDEPSTGVDRESQREIYAILKRINRDKGITIISVEHNLEAAISNSTLIYHLSRGQGHLCTPAQYAGEFVGGREGEDTHA